MQTQQKTYLKFIDFKDLRLWDVKRYSAKQIYSSFPIVTLGNYIQAENKKYKLFDEPESDFGILGVNNVNGIFDAYTQKGKEINQAYKKMQTGWIAYNLYRVNVGSIGIKKVEHKNEYISPAYVVFSCKEKLLPEFLFLIFKTNTFNQVINDNTTGSVRQNLAIDILKSLQIPLPSLSEQNAIVAKYFEKINRVKELEREAQNIEQEIEEYLDKILGIRYEEKQRKKGLQFVYLKDLKRWDIWNVSIHKNTSKFETVKLKSLITLKSGKFLPKVKTENGDYNVYGGNGISGKHNEYFLSGKRLVIGRVGEYCGNIHLIDGNYWVTDNAFIVDKISKDAIYEYLQIGIKHLNIGKYRSISAQPSISQSTILNLQFRYQTFPNNKKS